MATKADPRTLNARRSRLRTIGIAVTVGSAIILVFSPARAPLPFNTAVEIVLGAIGVIVGLAFIRAAYSIPVREILLLTQELKGTITAREVVQEMNLEPDNAERVLDSMVRMGYLRRDFSGRNQPPRYVVADRSQPSTPSSPEDDVVEIR